MNSGYRHIWRMLLPSLAVLLPLALRSQSLPDIAEVRPQVEQDSLKVEIFCPDLFTGAIRQTLFSGLPVLVEIRSRILREGQPIFTPDPAKYRLTYDIWEDRFQVEAARETRTFSTLEALQGWWNPFRAGIGLSVLPSDASTGWQVEVRMRIVLLSRAQSQKLKDWVFQAAETEEEMPARERDTGFKLNLNRLIGLFLSSNEVMEQFELVKTSPRFSLESKTNP